MQEHVDLVDRLIALADRLPTKLAEYAECLSRLRERAEGEGEEFRLTEPQREEVIGILAAVAQGCEGKQIPIGVPAPEDVAVLVERVRELREAKKAVEEELDSASEELTRLVGIGATVLTADARLRVGAPRLTLRIQDASALPAAFLSLQPDRRAILDHVREAAEVPPGAEVSESKPTLHFGKP